MKHRIFFTLLLLTPATQWCMLPTGSPRSPKKLGIEISVANPNRDDKYSKEEDESKKLKEMFEQDTQKTEQALRDINALASRTAQERKEHERTYTDMAAGVGAAVWGVWLYHANPAAVVRKAHMRFITGAEIPIAVGILKTILAPTAVLLLGCYAYYKIKQAIAEPYKQENEKMVADFKKMLVDHKAEVHDMYQKREQKINSDVIQLRTNIVTIQQMIDSVLAKEQQDNKEKHDKLLKEFAAFKTRVVAQHADAKTDLENIEKILVELSKKNKDLGAQAQAAVKQLEELAEKFKAYGNHSVRDAEIIQSHGEALKKIREALAKLQEQLAQKKDKKEKKGIFG